MREIKFRGKRVDTGVWVYGNVIFKTSDAYSKRIDCGIQSDHCYPQEVDKETVGQFTGLTDKNGVEIFEGDIVKIIDAPVEDDTFTVEWSDGKEFCIGFGLFSCFDYKVIGNIHEVSE